MKKIAVFEFFIIIALLTVFIVLLKSGSKNQNTAQNSPTPAVTAMPTDKTLANTPDFNRSDIIIVLDAGHGKASSKMSDDEKESSGWTYYNGGWGDWRHFKFGKKTDDCMGVGCSGRVTPNGTCWYPIVNSDRLYEPEINLNNALNAKRYLEELGYTIRLTRETNDENPSITKRLSYCYPDNDTEKSPDATVYLCIHSNAGGGSGTSYIALDGEYDHPEIPDNYVGFSNTLGMYVNDEIASRTPLKKNPPITYEPELVAFCKCPVICGYLEIGFYDNESDFEILNNYSDAIGKAIADGVDRFICELLAK